MGLEQLAEDLETGSSQESPRRVAVTKRGNFRCYTVNTFKNMKRKFLSRKVTSFTGILAFDSNSSVVQDSEA